MPDGCAVQRDRDGSVPKGASSRWTPARRIAKRRVLQFEGHLGASADDVHVDGGSASERARSHSRLLSPAQCVAGSQHRRTLLDRHARRVRRCGPRCRTSPRQYQCRRLMPVIKTKRHPARGARTRTRSDVRRGGTVQIYLPCACTGAVLVYDRSLSSMHTAGRTSDWEARRSPRCARSPESGDATQLRGGSPLRAGLEARFVFRTYGLILDATLPCTPGTSAVQMCAQGR